MSKKRILDSRTRKSQSFASLTYRQRDLWHGLIAVADDQGRLFGLTANVRSEVWPLDDIPLAEVDEDINKLSDLKMILIYEDNGKSIIQIINWWKYQQKQWAGPSDYPPPPNWIDRARYHGAEHKIIQENWDLSGGFCEAENQQPDSNKTPDLSGNKPPDFLPDNQTENDVGHSINDSDSDGINDSDDVNDGDGVTAKPNPDGIYTDLSVAFCNKTKLLELSPSPQKWYAALEKMGKAGVIEQDIENAVDILWEKDYSIVGLSSITNTAISEMSRRVGKKSDSNIDMEEVREKEAKETRERIARSKAKKEK